MRILIAHRDPAIARALERMLRQEDVTIAADAVTATGYDLVLGDRPEVLAAMREMPGSPACVLVVEPLTWEALCDAIAKARAAQRRERKPRRARRRDGMVTQEL